MTGDTSWIGRTAFWTGNYTIDFKKYTNIFSFNFAASQILNFNG